MIMSVYRPYMSMYIYVQMENYEGIMKTRSYIKMTCTATRNRVFYCCAQEARQRAALAQGNPKGICPMKMTYDLNLETFEAWSGAVSTLETIREAGACEQLEFILEDLYPEGMTETELNDLLWFEPETVFEWLGIETEEDEEE